MTNQATAAIVGHARVCRSSESSDVIRRLPSYNDCATYVGNDWARTSTDAVDEDEAGWGSGG